MAVARGEMDGSERCERSEKAIPFWDKWGAAWRCAGAHGALLVRAAKAGADHSGTPRVWGLRGSERPHGGWRARWRRPHPGRASSALCHPTQPARAEGRVGPPRCARGWAESGRCAAPPRPGQVPSAAPRVKVKVSLCGGRAGGGAGEDLGAGAGHRGAMDGLGRRLRASLRLKRGRGG